MAEKKIVGIRLEENEIKKFEELEKATGLTKRELIVKRILNAAEQQNCIGKEDLHFFKQEIKEIVEDLKKNPYGIFEEILKTEEERKNILNYNAGYLLKNTKGRLALITDIDKEKEIVEIAVYPITKQTEFKKIDFKKVIEQTIAVYRQ